MTRQEIKRNALEAQGWNQIDEKSDGCLVMKRTLSSGEHAFCYIRRNGQTYTHNNRPYARTRI